MLPILREKSLSITQVYSYTLFCCRLVCCAFCLGIMIVLAVSGYASFLTFPRITPPCDPHLHALPQRPARTLQLVFEVVGGGRELLDAQQPARIWCAARERGGTGYRAGCWRRAAGDSKRREDRGGCLRRGSTIRCRLGGAQLDDDGS